MGGLIVGLVLGALLGAASTKKKPIAKKKKTTQALVKGQTQVIPLPQTQEDFEVLDEVICTCAQKIEQELPEEAKTNVHQLVESTRLCVAQELYPEVQWPPGPGDDTTIERFWFILTYEIGRAAIEGTLCPPEENEAQIFVPPP
jgi:hypothetical protein